jgi:hypothetical protein
MYRVGACSYSVWARAYPEQREGMTVPQLGELETTKDLSI